MKSPLFDDFRFRFFPQKRNDWSTITSSRRAPSRNSPLRLTGLVTSALSYRSSRFQCCRVTSCPSSRTCTQVVHLRTISWLSGNLPTQADYLYPIINIINNFYGATFRMDVTNAISFNRHHKETHFHVCARILYYLILLLNSSLLVPEYSTD